jgi:hypothetical protein
VHDADDGYDRRATDSPRAWGLRRLVDRLVDRLMADLRGPRYITLGIAVTIVSTLAVLALYANHPQPEISVDTPSYLQGAQRIISTGRLVDAMRMPGYPLLIALIFTVAGKGNLAAVSAVQAALFVLSTVEVYVSACLLLRRAWAACAIGLAVGGNLILLGFATPILPDGLSLWLVVTLALAVIVFLYRMTVLNLWLVAGCLLALMLTRAEWIYAPILLFVFLLAAAWRRGALRRVLPDAVAALIVLYAATTSYAAVNSNQNGYFGTSCIVNVNLLGKVMQYGMQADAPTQYKAEASIMAVYVARGDYDPWHVISDHPEFGRHCYSLAGAYAGSVIRHSPLEFLVKSASLAVSSPTNLDSSGPAIVASGQFAGSLALLEWLSYGLYWLGWLLIPCSLLWAALNWLRTSRDSPVVQAMAAIALLALYGLGATAMGGYADYGRLDAPVEPLLLVVVGSTIVVACLALTPVALRLVVQRAAWRGAGWMSGLGWLVQGLGQSVLHAVAPVTRRAPMPQPTPPMVKEARPVARPAHQWEAQRYLLPGALLIVITSALVAAFYLNHPAPEVFPDTPSYTNVAQRILTRGQPIDDVRMPGYPLLIALVYLAAGSGNVAAVAIAQAVLFVLATVAIYALVCVVLQRRWAAFAVSLLVGGNLTLLSFIKPILSEGMALWLTVSLALATTLFVRTLRARELWLVGGIALALLMTRSEWEYGFILLLAYLLLVAARHGRFLRLVPHAVLMAALFFGTVWGYSAMNQAQNGYNGLTKVVRINLLGKVMQYHMQNEAPPEYAWAAPLVDAYVQQGDLNPYDVLQGQPTLARNFDAPAGAYATAIIMHHPLEFLADSIPVAISSLGTQYYSLSKLDPSGPYFGLLHLLLSLSTSLYNWYGLFPLCALLWLLLLVWPHTARLRSTEMMGGVILLALFGATLTTLSGYEDYPRLHTPYDPLMIVVIAGTVVIAGEVVHSWGGNLGSVRPFLKAASQGLASVVRSAGSSPLRERLPEPGSAPNPGPRAAQFAVPLTSPVPDRPSTWRELEWNLPASTPMGNARAGIERSDSNRREP